MSEEKPSPILSMQAQRVQRPGRGKLWLVAASVAVMFGFAGMITAQVFSPRHAWGATALMMGTDAADAEENATWMAWRLANYVDASVEQKTRLVAIARTAARDLFPIREKMEEMRKRAIELLREPTPNREEIEKLRVQIISNADAASKRIAHAIGDMGDTLTFEQRKNLAEDLSFFSRHWDSLRG